MKEHSKFTLDSHEIEFDDVDKINTNVPLSAPEKNETIASNHNKEF